MEALALVTRGSVVESVHYGDIAVCDARGRLLAAVGDPSHCVYWRSSAKPVQALTVVHSGAADRFRFTARELAVCCASHSGSAEHVAAVSGILAKLGLDATALQCGIHWPGDTAERDRLILTGGKPSPLHNNCSGKHAGKLAGTVALGADPATYLEPSHPVQQSIVADMSVLCGEAPAAVGVDGCGAPTHATALQAMATAFARLAWPDAMPARLQRAAPRIVAAMAAEPVMVSAGGSFNTELLAAGQGRVVAKAGAEGLFVLGLTEHGIGVAIRAADGSGRGQAAIVLRVLDELAALPDDMREALAQFAVAPLVNCHGAEVGTVRAADFALHQPAMR